MADGGALDLLADMSGTSLHNVGGSSFSNVDLTPQMDITNPMFARGGVTNKKSENIKDWYTKTYPTDDLGEQINCNSTFSDLWNSLHNKENLYEIMGVEDTVVRERLFEHLSEIKGVNYDYVYNKWLQIDDYADGGMMADGGMAEKYVVKQDKDGTYKILNTEKNMYVDYVFETKASADGWKKEKDYQRKTFGRESYFADGGMMAKGGKIKVGDKVRSTTFKGIEGEVLSKEKDYFFVRQYDALPNGDFQHHVLRIDEVEKMAHGGSVPTNYGEGRNINVFGYETKFFINCPKAVEEFENSIQHANTDEEKENLSNLAEHIDKIFEIEHEVVHQIASSSNSFDEAIKETITASYWNYRSGMAIDLFSFIPQHLKEIALRINNTKFEDGGVLNLLSDTSGAGLQNVGGSSFSNVDLTPQMDITNPMFAKGGGTFNVQEFRDILGEGVTTLYEGFNGVEVAIRYMEINGQGGMVSAFKKQYKVDELLSIIEKLDDASENKYAHGGQTKQKYKIFEGYDSYKNNPIYSVHGVDNDYFGEWHTSMEEAKKELNELNKKHYAKGGGIPNNYRGRTTEDIWNSLTENQRVHFMFDHFDELGTNESELVRLANKDFKDLNEDVQGAFKTHTMMGQYAHGGLTEHGLQIGDKIVDKSNYSQNAIQVMNNGKYAMVDLDKGERIEGIYADGGQVNNKYQIVNSKGYFSRSMKTGKPIFINNFELGYSYTKNDADKMLQFLKKETNDSELKVVPFGSVKFKDEYADGGMMAKGGNVGTWTFIAVAYNDDEDMTVKEKKVFKVKATTRSSAYQKAYKKYPRPYFVELYSVDSYADGGETDDDMGVQFIDYKDEMIMYEPHYKEYYTNDIQFDSLEKAKKYIDNGSKMTPAQINLYRKGAMADGGSINKYWLRWDSINSRGGVNRNNKEFSELPKNIVVNQSNYVFIKKDTVNGKDYVPVRIIGGFSGVQLSEQEIKDKKIKRVETMEFAKGGKTTFKEKVKSISQSLLKRKKVSPSVQKDYGKTYNKKEAVDSAKRIVGAIKKKAMAKNSKLKIKEDDFSFLNNLTERELSKRLDLVQKQQVINSKQYFSARDKKQSTTKIEESRIRLDKQERAIIEARLKKMDKKKS